MIVTLIEKVYSFLWGDLVQIPLPGGRRRRCGFLDVGDGNYRFVDSFY